MKCKRQTSIFGTFVKENKDYIVYKDPKNAFEKYVERHCLREKKIAPTKTKFQLNEAAVASWNSVKGNDRALQEFLKLREGEKEFSSSSSSPEKPLASKQLKGFFQSHPKADNKTEPPKTTEKTMDVEDEDPIAVAPTTIPDLVTVETSPSTKIQLKENLIHTRVRNFLYIHCPALTTDDVIGNASFVEGLAEHIAVINDFLSLDDSYNGTRQRRGRKTKLTDGIESVKGKLSALCAAFQQASEIKIDVTKGLELLSVSASAKNTALVKCVTLAAEVVGEIYRSNVINGIRKQMRQNSLKKEQNLAEIFRSNMSLTCFNSELSWTDAFLRAEENKGNLPCAKIQLVEYATCVESECFVDPDFLPTQNRREIINALLKWFPILLAERPTKSCLINIHELILNSDAFLCLLQDRAYLGTDEDENADNCEASAATNEETMAKQVQGAARKPGPKPLHERFPELVKVTTDFIKSHSFAAHSRRRSSTGTGTGVSLKDIQEHVIQNVPGLKEAGGVKIDALHQLFIAPRKHSSRAFRYKGLVNARVPRKKNDYRENSENQHFLFARVKYREEFVARFSKEACFYSADDMNKLRMAPSTAVSRYHQQFRFFMQEDSPNLPDHDFVNPRYLLVPSGYMRLEPTVKELPEDEQIYFDPQQNDVIGEPNLLATEYSPDSSASTDKLGRKHHPRLAAGPSMIVLRACKFQTSSAETHVNDMLPLLKGQVEAGKGVAFIKVDNGSDWNLLSTINELFFCRLWKHSGLDVLGIVSYAAKWSAYNNVEHLWSPASRLLANLILQSILEGESKPPCRQSGLSEDALRLKEAQIFDAAMSHICNNNWANFLFNGAEVMPQYRPCLEDNTPFSDYTVVHKILSGSGTMLRQSKDLMREMRFMLAHMERKSHELIFRKCIDPKCDYCSTHPIVARNAWTSLKEDGFRWPNPQTSNEHPGHFMTYIELTQQDAQFYLTGDEGIPKPHSIGACPYCPCYHFMSFADKKKHLFVFHHDKKGDNNPVWKKEFRCRHQTGQEQCGLVFASANKLREHKSKEGHVKRKKKACATTLLEAACAKKRQLTLAEAIKPSDVQQITQQISDTDICGICGDDDDDPDSDESDKEVCWVMCESCRQWYHLQCVNTEMPENQPKKKAKWFCCKSS